MGLACALAFSFSSAAYAGTPRITVKPSADGKTVEINVTNGERVSGPISANNDAKDIWAKICSDKGANNPDFDKKPGEPIKPDQQVELGGYHAPGTTGPGSVAKWDQKVRLDKCCIRNSNGDYIAKEPLPEECKPKAAASTTDKTKQDAIMIEYDENTLDAFGGL